MGKPPHIISPTSFYDTIAGDYNSHMHDGDGIRDAIQELFSMHVPEGSKVLDFGGGTGLDIPRMSKHYQVLFLEPSEKMRSIAKEVDKQNVQFIEKNLDFNKWLPGNLPFEEKADAVLMNYAVLNCIKNIEVLFEKLSMLCNDGCIIMAAVITHSNEIVFKNQPLKLVLHNMVNKLPIIYQNYNGVGHETYVHSLKSYKTAAKPYFNFVSYTPTSVANFHILILSKK